MEPKRAVAEADRLSSLPVVLQDEILIRLDLRDAVRTSALSRAWRNLWKSLSEISLSFPIGTHPSVVDSVLLPYIGPRVSLFDICVVDASAGRIDPWLVALSRCRVESIHMRGRLISAYNFNLHSSIFSFGDLVSLRLQCCNIPPLPVGFAGFPTLQELDLYSVNFPDNGDKQLEAIIRQSPLLHTLIMFDVFIPDDYPESVIEAPNLRILLIYSEYDYGWRFGDLPCLEYANIYVLFCPEHEHDFGDFLARFARVQKLTLFSPLRGDVDESFEADWEFLNALWTDGMCASLQIVRMSRIAWLPNEISFMKLMLSTARLLRALCVDRHPDEFDDPLIDLLKCKRASAHARVLFEGLVQQYLMRRHLLCIAECKIGSLE